MVRRVSQASFACTLWIARLLTDGGSLSLTLPSQTLQESDFSSDYESNDLESGVGTIRLPARDLQGQDYPKVEAECHVCLKHYEAGDTVVWSSTGQCCHTYCEDCILEWLSRGKKRCPLCREWFVPAEPIPRQKKQRQRQTTQQTLNFEDDEEGSISSREDEPEADEPMDEEVPTGDEDNDNC